MSVRVIRMPDIGEGIAEVEVVAWHVQPGDTVAEDQVLADVMTEKATVEIPSPVAGRVLSLHGEIGQTMAVGADLIHIEVAAEDGDGGSAAGPADRETEGGTAQARSAGMQAPGAVAASERSAAPAATGDAGGAAAAVVAAHAETVPRAAQPPDVGEFRPLASPAVRRRARELGIALAEVTPSGPGGRVVHADLDAFVERSRKAPVAAGGPARPSAVMRPDAAIGDPRYQRRDDEERVQVVGLRRRIAQKMQEAKRRIPHFSYVEEVDVTEVEALRARLNERWADSRGKLTLLPLLIRALVLALRDYPQMNARFDDEAGIVTRFGAVHVGIATQTGMGLMVPVLRNAEALDPWACAAGIAHLADAARSGRATREELGGSTITVTSLGALGGIASTPVINHPEVAIVGVNRMVERPVIRDGAVVARRMMNLSSSFDHRVVDGMHAAEFVQAIRAGLECPALLFVE